MTATPYDPTRRFAPMTARDRSVDRAASAHGVLTASHRRTAWALIVAGCLVISAGALAHGAGFWLVMPGLASALVGLSFGPLAPPRR